MYGMYVDDNLLSSTFSDTIWSDIAKELQERTKKIYNIGQLKGKACRLRDNPREAKLRYKGLPHYPYCTEMFGSSIATGDLARSSTMSTWDSNEEDDLNNSYLISSGCANGVGGSPLPNERANLEMNINEIPESNSQHTSKETKSTKSNRSSRIDHALDAWASVNSARARKTWLGELLSGHPDRFPRSLRMNKNAFIALCELLTSRDLIKVSRNTRVGCEESLAIFLSTVGFTTSQRISCERFQHSLETISRHIKRVTKALNKLALELITNPDFTTVHPKILGSPQLFPYFKDCVGAIDGTLVSAWVPARRHNAYRSRKSEVSQNIMAICDFNLLFTYVMAGWEGSANNSRVLIDAIMRDSKFPWPPEARERGPFSDPATIDRALHQVQSRMNQLLDYEYPIDELRTRFQELQHDFNVFTVILATPVYADGKESTERLNIAGQTLENPIILSDASCEKFVGISSRHQLSQMNKGKNVSVKNGKEKQIPDAFSIPWAGSKVLTHESHNGRHNLAGVAIEKGIVRPHPLMHHHLIDEPSEESTAASKTPWATIDSLSFWFPKLWL
ncbi:hypothetical protein C2S52_006299 [Perilla frutescens var. hirtella]|nr:hypothetical protein C2S52_006299 [Perilla frutescens var. hirtella]